MAGLVVKWLSSFLNYSSHAQYCGCQQNGVDYQQINADIVFASHTVSFPRSISRPNRRWQKQRPGVMLARCFPNEKQPDKTRQEETGNEGDAFRVPDKRRYR